MIHGSKTFVYVALAVLIATTDTFYTTSAWALVVALVDAAIAWYRGRVTAELIEADEHPDTSPFVTPEDNIRNMRSPLLPVTSFFYTWFVLSVGVPTVQWSFAFWSG